ncbi:MAG: hypothetical protein II997_09095 [Clostridia bacterium]|nr:hypothetical protein [Clostridia bacterium]
MVKFLGKKVLATLIVLSLVVTLAPFTFAANSTTSVTKYSDLGLTELTPYHTINNENLTVAESTDEETGETTCESLLTDAYNANGMRNSSSSSRVEFRDFNHSNVVSGVTRAYDAVVGYEDDTTKANKVAKIKGRATATETVGVLAGGDKAPRMNKVGKDLQVWEVKVKLSTTSATPTGHIRLFGWAGANWYSRQQYSDDTYGTTVKILDGTVYVTPDTYTSRSQSAAKYTQAIAKLDPNKWYKFVRVMKLSTTSYYSKVYVFDENDNIVTSVIDGNEVKAGYDDWRLAGTYYQDYPKSHGIATLGIPEGDCLMIDDYTVYGIDTGDITCAAADSNNAITMSQGDAPLTFTANNFSFLSGEMSKITLTNGGETFDVCELQQDGTIQADLSALPAGSYTLSFDNITNPVGDNISKTYTITIQSPTFSIGDVEFVGEDGVTPVASITQGTKVKAKVTMTNSGADQDFVIILALYKDNQLKQVIFKDDEPATDGTHSYITNALTAESDGMTACIYVWDSWDSLQPFIDATPFE